MTRQREIELENERYQSLYKFTVDSEYDGIGIIDVNSGNTEVKVARHINPRRTISQGDFEDIKTRFIDLFICENDRDFFQNRITLPIVLERLESSSISRCLVKSSIIPTANTVFPHSSNLTLEILHLHQKVPCFAL